MFAEPAIDMLYEEKMPDDTRSAIFFAVEYLPGQYDQRADSAAQCIKLMSGGRKQAEDGQDAGDAVVKFARVIVLEGRLSSKEKEAVKNYCVNPVDSRIAAVEKPENLEMEQTEPEDVASIEGFTDMTEPELEAYRKEMGFAMSAEDIKFVQEYYRDTEKRQPTVTEIKVIDTYWSDHCRHTTFNTALYDIEFEESPYGSIVKEAFEKIS